VSDFLQVLLHNVVNTLLWFLKPITSQNFLTAEPDQFHPGLNKTQINKAEREQNLRLIKRESNETEE
jgi:hypothetical protein